MKTKSKALRIALVIAALFQTLILSSRANADEVDGFSPDHYLSYEIKAPSFGAHKIQLRDQFIDWTDFVVDKPVRLLNPTLKRHNDQVFPIENKDLHYAAYDLESKEDALITSPIIVTNQFGTFVLEEFLPSRLLAPTRKKDLTPLDFDAEAIIGQDLILADHYLCYEIPPFEIETGFGFLKDQFRGRDFEKLTARHFCNPVAKIHDDHKFDILDDSESNHLMCFELEKSRILRLVAILNQFGLNKAIVTKDDELCVPSFTFKMPQDCKGSSPNEDGICNGYCQDFADTCQVDPKSGECACLNEVRACFDQIPNSDGICNGICEKPDDVCEADAAGFCNCLPRVPTPCFDTKPDDDGICNGFCPDREICVGNADSKCECQPERQPCGFSPDGVCGGDCPPQEKCSIIPGTEFCACVLG